MERRTRKGKVWGPTILFKDMFLMILNSPMSTPTSSRFFHLLIVSGVQSPAFNMGTLGDTYPNHSKYIYLYVFSIPFNQLVLQKLVLCFLPELTGNAAWVVESWKVYITSLENKFLSWIHRSSLSYFQCSLF